MATDDEFIQVHRDIIWHMKLWLQECAILKFTYEVHNLLASFFQLKIPFLKIIKSIFIFEFEWLTIFFFCVSTWTIHVIQSEYQISMRCQFQTMARIALSLRDETVTKDNWNKFAHIAHSFTLLNSIKFSGVNSLYLKWIEMS